MSKVIANPSSSHSQLDWQSLSVIPGQLQSLVDWLIVTRSHLQSLTVTGSYLYSLVVTRSLAQRQLQSLVVTRSHLQLHAATRSHFQSLLVWLVYPFITDPLQHDSDKQNYFHHFHFSTIPRLLLPSPCHDQENFFFFHFFCYVQYVMIKRKKKSFGNYVHYAMT